MIFLSIVGVPFDHAPALQVVVTRGVMVVLVVVGEVHPFELVTLYA
jgi:hypothetical protein